MLKMSSKKVIQTKEHIDFLASQAKQTLIHDPFQMETNASNAIFKTSGLRMRSFEASKRQHEKTRRLYA